MKNVILTLLFMTILSPTAVSQNSAEAIKVKRTSDFELSGEGKKQSLGGRVLEFDDVFGKGRGPEIAV